MDDPWGSEDPLGEALHLVRMSGAFYSRGELSEPWGMELMAVPGYVWFHVVTAGRAEVVAGEAEPLALGPGELALVPHGEGHVLRSDAAAATQPILELDREVVGERYEVIRHGGGGPATRMVCAAVRFDHPAALDLVRALPRVLRVDSQAEWLHSTTRLMAGEVAARRPGGEVVITRLTDVLVVQAIRSWLDSDPAARTGLARRAAGSADRARDRARPPRPGARLDARLARARGGDVALGVRGPLHGAGRRAGDALRGAPPDAPGGGRPARRGRDRRRGRRPLRLPLRGSVQPRVQAGDGDAAGSGAAGRASRPAGPV